MVGSLSVPSGRCARGTVDGFDLHLNIIVERWLCTKTLILVSVERSVQYRERSAAVAHSTNQPSEFRRNVECAIRSLRSRYCTDRSTLTKIRVFVRSPRSHSNLVDSTLDSTWFVLLRGPSRFFWTKRNDPQSRLCTKSNMPTVQYRERSAA